MLPKVVSLFFVFFSGLFLSFTFANKGTTTLDKSKIRPVLSQGSGDWNLFVEARLVVTGGLIIIVNHWLELTDMQEPASLVFVSDWRRSYGDVTSC